MKEKITAIISLLGAIGWGFFGLFIMTQEGIDNDELLPLLALFLSTVSTILYIVWTNFGNKRYSEIEKIDNENQILKKQIEQKELKKKLED